MWILVTLRPDTCTLLGCGFDERAVGHWLTAFRSWSLSICCVVPVWFVLVFSNLDIPNGSSLPAAAGSFRSDLGSMQKYTRILYTLKVTTWPGADLKA